MIELNVPGTQLTLKGECTEILEFLNSQGIDITSNGEYYLSSTKGLIKVSDMEIFHLKNALKKEYKRYIDDLFSKELSNQELSEKLVDFSENKLLMNMLSSLYKRVDAGDLAGS